MDRNQEIIVKPNRGQLVIEGMDVIIKRELDRHKMIISTLNKQIEVLKEQVDHLKQKKSAWANMIGQRRFRADSMQKAIKEMEDQITSNTNELGIKRQQLAYSMKQVTMYDEQMNEYYRGLADLAQARKEEMNGNSNRLR